MSGKTLYLDGFSGISGDMTVAALLDLGGSEEKLKNTLKTLPLDGCRIEISRKKNYGIEGCDFDVILPHHGEHTHDHHAHRHYPDILEILKHADLTDNARKLAEKIFQIIAESEAKAHGISLNEVHFHEVGAIDSIADIVSAAVLIDDLEISDCIVTGLSEGTGTVHCQHGTLPVPVPAVVNIAQKFEIPLHPTDRNGEMITPTGIAIAAALRTKKSLPASYQILKTGIGLGKRDFGCPNFLRAMLISPEHQKNDRIWVLETNIDDSTGEMLGYAMEKLFAAGAKDAVYLPCYMKKNRPGVLLKVIAEESEIPALESVIFRETTAIGLRKYPVERCCMDREIISVETKFGMIEVKHCFYQGISRFYPEFESVKSAAVRTGADFREIFEEAILCAKKNNAETD